ncbi:MAG: S-layer homology domain-containing protein [Candidatus Ornithomonoglobus sp.]
MFYLKDNTFFSSGSGIESDPYTVDNNDSYTPATEAPTPTPQPTSLKIYCNEPSLSTTVGNSFLIGAALTDEDGNYSSASGITFDVEDSGILKAVKTTDDENTRYITFNAVGTGTTTIKITDGKSWQTAELPFTVNKASANAYTIYNIPNIGSDDANFYNFTGLYIDSFKVKNKSNGSAELSFDVYNQNPTYGTVEVYDNSGELIDAEIIGKTAFETSIVSIWGTVTEIGKDISEGVYNPMSYKSSIQSKKTEIRNLSVPAGGYIKISVDTRESSVCGIINALDLISQTSGLVSNAKKQEDVPKTAIEKLKNNGNKFLEQYQTKFVKELTNKTIGSTDDLTSYLSNIANMFLNGDLRELAVSVLASSAVGTAESAVMDWLKQAGNPAQAGLSAFWKISKIDNLIYQTAMFAKRANCGSITIQVPDGNVRRCSDITVKCTMNNNTAVEVCRTDINSSLLATIKNLNKNIFGSSQIIGYDINLVEDGEVIQPDGTAEVTINIPEWMQSGKNISVYRAENDGSVTDMNGKVSGDAITFETDHFSTYILSADGIEVDPPETAEGQTLVNGDTIVSDWAAEEVQEAFDEELVPDILHGADLTKKVDRAEFAAIAVTLYENLSKKTAQPGENPFGDISGNYCKDDILKAYNLGITNGITNVTFEPSTLISREQVATMLTRAYKKSEFPNWTLATDGDYPLNYMGVTKYADDNEISDYAKESVYFMTRWDILNGIDDSHFAPKNNTTLGESYGYATREQAVVIALRSAKHL